MLRTRSLRFLLACSAAAVLSACDRSPTAAPAVDATAPRLDLVSPGAGMAPVRDSVTVQGTAVDSGGVTRLAYVLNGEPEREVPVQPGITVPFSFRVGLRDGTNQIRVRAYDAAGNRGETTASVARDDRPGVVVAFPGAADTTLAALALPVAVTVTHPTSVRVAYAVNGGAERTVSSAWAGTGPLRFAVNDLAPGRNTVAVYAYDAAGKKGEARLSLNVTAPVLRYEVTFLGNLGGKTSTAVDLNEKGQVVGYVETLSGEYRAYLWEDGRMTALAPGLGMRSFATGINESGQVSGWYLAAGDCRKAILWEGGAVRELTGCGASALDVTDAGEVLLDHGTLWRNGAVTRVGSLATATRVNERGQVLGTVFDPVLGPRSALWDGRAVVELPFGGGDLNAAARVVGWSPGRGGTGGGAYLWEAGKTTTLGTLGIGFSLPSAVNDRGEVVGTFPADMGAFPSGVGWRPFLLRNGTMYGVVPTDAAWKIVVVAEINEAGWIVGEGRNTATGESGAVLLKPAA